MQSPPYPARWQRAAGAALDVAGVAALLALMAVNLHRFDLNWDSIEYHLPFAALRTGLMRHGAFEMRGYLESRFQGFPPLADWVQGLLWRLTGRPEATQLVSPIALAAFAAYGRWVFGVRVLWSVAIAAAIPIVLTALNSANLDVWTNAFFCVYLLAAFTALRLPSRRWWVHTLIASAALAVAVNSKMQFFVLGAAALAIQGAAALVLIWRDDRVMARRQRGRSLLLTVVLAPLVFASPIRNLVRFGNPVYPFAVTVLGTALPGTQTNSWVGPNRLAGLNGPERYALSQLDFDAINSRFQGFNQDQGGQAEGADGNRMGGALSVLLISSAGALLIGLRRRRWSLPDWVALAASACLLAAVAAFPGASELRYFCFVNILTSFAALVVLRDRAQSGDGYAAGLLTGLRLLLVGSVVFTSFATGLRQLGTTDRRTLADIRAGEGTDAALATALATGNTLCYIRPDPKALLFSPLLNPVGRGRDYRILIRDAAWQCPPGAAVIP